MRTIVCAGCGRLVETMGSRTKYCPECKRKTAAAQKREYERRKRESMKIEDGDKDMTFHTCDTPENIAKCLACKIPQNRCRGACFVAQGKKKG